MADIRELVESALQTYLDRETDADVFTGTDDANKAVPCVIVAAGNYHEEHLHSAVYRVSVSVSIRSAVDDLTDHNTLVGVVHDALRLDSTELATELSSDTLRVYGFSDPDRYEAGAEDDVYTDTITLEIMASPL